DHRTQRKREREGQHLESHGFSLEGWMVDGGLQQTAARMNAQCGKTWKHCRSWRESTAGGDGLGWRLAITLLENRVVETVGENAIAGLGTVPQLPHVLAAGTILGTDHGRPVGLAGTHLVLARNRALDGLAA